MRIRAVSCIMTKIWGQSQILMKDTDNSLLGMVWQILGMEWPETWNIIISEEGFIKRTANIRDKLFEIVLDIERLSSYIVLGETPILLPCGQFDQILGIEWPKFEIICNNSRTDWPGWFCCGTVWLVLHWLNTAVFNRNLHFFDWLSNNFRYYTSNIIIRKYMFTSKSRVFFKSLLITGILQNVHFH